MTNTGAGRPVHVVLIASIFPPPFVGGAERSTAAMAAELGDAGMDVTAIALQPDGIARHEKTDFGEIIRWRIPNIYWRWTNGTRSRILQMMWNTIELLPSLYILPLYLLVRRKRADVIVVSSMLGWAYSPWIVSRLSGIPLIHVTRDYQLICARVNRMRDAKGCDSLCGKCKLRTKVSTKRWPGGTAVGVSQSVLDLHRKNGLFIQDPEFVSHPKINLPNHGHAPHSTIRSAYEHIGYLGRISPEKGVELLLQAADTAGVTVQVAGTGDDAYIEKLKQLFPAATFLGTVDTNAFLACIDSLVIPSLWDEPYGRVAAEAAAAGVPTVLSRRGGLVEAAQSSGGVYMSFDPGDPDELTAILLQLKRGSFTPEESSATWSDLSMVEIVRKTLIHK